MFIQNINRSLLCCIFTFLMTACVKKDDESNWKEVSCRFFSLDIPLEYSFEEDSDEMADWSHYVVKDEQDSVILNVFESTIPNGSRNGDVYGNLNSKFQLIDSHVSVDGSFAEGDFAVYSVLYGRYSETGVSSFVHFLYLANSPQKALVKKIIQSIKNPPKRAMKKIDATLSICNRAESVLPLGYSAVIDDTSRVCVVRDSRNDEVAWILESNLTNPPEFRPLPDTLLTSSFELVDYFRSPSKRLASPAEMNYSEIYGKLNEKRKPVFVQFIYTDFMEKSGLADQIRSTITLEK